MRRRSGEGTLLSLDVGTGTVRGVLFDLHGEVIHTERRPRHYEPDPAGGSFLLVFNAQKLWSDICELIRDVIRRANIPADSILAVSTTCQRLSFVFLDPAGDPVYAGPNLDTRGMFTQGDIEEKMGEEIYVLTGQWPPLTSALAKILWFKQEAPDRFRKIRTILMLNDWVQYKLCGEKRSEPTAASASMLLEIATRRWSGKILEAFDLDAQLLPPLAEPAERIGAVHRQGSSQTGLAMGTPIVVSGADTQCALLAAGPAAADHVAIVAGTTAPVCYIQDVPFTDPGRRLWTSCHMTPDSWILEANSQLSGSVYQWLRDLVGELLEQSDRFPNPYAWMEQQASAVPAGSEETFALLGPVVMDAGSFHVVRPGLFLFPPPVQTVIAPPVRIGNFIRATLENIAYALRANVEQLVSLKGARPDRIGMTGGLCESPLFCQILADCLGVAVEVGSIREGSALGAAICSAVGTGAFASLQEATKALCRQVRVFEPNRENRSDYQHGFARWSELYHKIVEI